MWKINDKIKTETVSDLIINLTVLLSHPAPVMFSFDTNDTNVTYLVSAATFPFFNPLIIQQAKNIKAWQKII